MDEHEKAEGVGRRELMLRVNSALVLGALAVGATYAGLWPFAVLVSIVSVLVCWEWSRLVRGRTFDALLAAHLTSVLCAALLTANGQPGGGLIILFLGGAGLVALGDGRADRLSVLGVFYAGLPAVAMVWLRSDASYGWAVILFLYLMVWSADTGAFIAGRLVGGPRLWPSISPGKTWAGLFGGLLMAALAATCYAAIGGRDSVHIFAMLGLILAGATLAGDLLESALKRRFHHKDASSLIPGHGGVMDRVDGLVVAACVAAALALMRDPDAPGRALLVWH